MAKHVMAIGMISHLHRTSLKILKIEDELTSVDIKPYGEKEHHLVRYGEPVRQPITLSMQIVEVTMATKKTSPIQSVEKFLLNRLI